MPRFFGGFCRSIPKTLLRHHSTQIMIIYPPKSEHFSPKIDHHQQLLNIYPKSNRSLPKMVIYALFTSKCRESHLHAFVVKSSARIGVRGGGVEPILAMPRFSQRLLQHSLPKSFPVIIIIVSGRMTGEFRAKLWAHSARDWAINSPEFGALILMI